MALTGKELSWLEDQLNLEQLMVKKYRMAESMTQDEAVRTKLKSAGDRHQQHFNKLLGHLN